MAGAESSKPRPPILKFRRILNPLEYSRNGRTSSQNIAHALTLENPLKFVPETFLMNRNILRIEGLSPTFIKTFEVSETWKYLGIDS